MLYYKYEKLDYIAVKKKDHLKITSLRLIEFLVSTLGRFLGSILTCGSWSLDFGIVILQYWGE